MQNHKLIVIQKTKNLIMIYIETTKDVHLEKQERIKPKNFNNHNTDESDISLDKPKQEIQRNNEGEQDVPNADVIKDVRENEEANVELVVGSSGKRKTNTESQQRLRKKKKE